jgi:hypothetical protein
MIYVYSKKCQFINNDEMKCTDKYALKIYVLC